MPLDPIVAFILMLLMWAAIIGYTFLAGARDRCRRSRAAARGAL